MFLIRYTSILLLIFLLAFEGVFNFYKVGGLSIVRLLELVFFVFVIKSFLRSFNNEILKTIYLMFVFLLLCVGIKLFSTTFFEKDFDSSTLKTIFTILFLTMYLFLNYYIVERNFKNINKILLFNFVILIIAFFQSSLTPLTDLAWDIKNNYFGSNSIGLKIEDEVSFRNRVIGLYGFSIPLAYILTTNMILTVYIFIKTKRNVILIYFVFLGVIAIFSLTRSVILSWAILSIYLIYINLFKLNVFRKVLFLSVILSIISYSTTIYIQNADTLERVTKTDGASAQGRIPLAITGIYATLKHPFGVSKTNYDIAKEEMFLEFNNHHILEFSSHNGIVNVGLTYTLFGLLTFFYFVFVIFRIMKKNLDKEMRHFFYFAVLAYLGNSLFHNRFIIIDDFYALIILAILAYEVKLFKEKRIMS